MLKHSCSVVTLTYEGDLPLLEVQARSFARHVPEGFFTEIVVIDNSSWGMGRRRTAALSALYGPHQPVVRVVSALEIEDLGATYGWVAQQILKLTVAEQVQSDRYLLLDAKNVVVAPLHPDFLEAPDGRPLSRAYHYDDHPLRASLERVLAYVGLDPAVHVARFTPTVTPFVVETRSVLDLLADVESRSGRPFSVEFARAELTEFFLYSAWLTARRGSISEVFDLSQPRSPNVWPRDGIDGLRREILLSDGGRSPIFTVHQRGVGDFSAAQSLLLAQFWTDRGIFDDVADAVAAVDAAAGAYARSARVRRVRVPRRVRTPLRKLGLQMFPSRNRPGSPATDHP